VLIAPNQSGHIGDHQTPGGLWPQIRRGRSRRQEMEKVEEIRIMDAVTERLLPRKANPALRTQT
jgi:hypothetical protein